jgi:hypothetical protein
VVGLNTVFVYERKGPERIILVIDRAHSTYREEKRCIQGFDEET